MARSSLSSSVTWRWRDGSRYPADLALALGEEISEVRDNSGKIDVHELVKRARRKSSPLHDYLTWDDTEAAARWRVHEMRQMVSVLVEVDEATSVEYPVAVSLSSDPGYQSTRTVLDDKLRRSMLVDQAWREFKYWRSKYKHLRELAEIFEAADRIKV